MPGKKKKYNARFPPARIKKIMQKDEEIGKVAAAVPVIISRALELFVESLLKKASMVTVARNSRTLSATHLKQCILSESLFDFLKNQVENVSDAQPDEEDGSNPLPPLDLSAASSSTNNHNSSFSSAPGGMALDLSVHRRHASVSRIATKSKRGRRPSAIAVDASRSRSRPRPAPVRANHDDGDGDLLIDEESSSSTDNESDEDGTSGSSESDSKIPKVTTSTRRKTSNGSSKVSSSTNSGSKDRFVPYTSVLNNAHDFANSLPMAMNNEKSTVIRGTQPSYPFGGFNNPLDEDYDT